MKIPRLFTIVLLAVLVISTWAPAPAYAKSSDTNSTSTLTLTVDIAKDKPARLRVTNHTGGTLHVRFSGPKSYSFSTSKQGKTIFGATIESGKYRVTVWSDACKGTLTFTRNAKGGTVGFPSFVCLRGQTIY